MSTELFYTHTSPIHIPMNRLLSKIFINQVHSMNDDQIFYSYLCVSFVSNMSMYRGDY